jgi:hypothetical protein
VEQVVNSSLLTPHKAKVANNSTWNFCSLLILVCDMFTFMRAQPWCCQGPLWEAYFAEQIVYLPPPTCNIEWGIMSFGKDNMVLWASFYFWKLWNS